MLRKIQAKINICIINGSLLKTADFFRQNYVSIDKQNKKLYNRNKKKFRLIKSGGGTGPVKPGNLIVKYSRKVLIPAVNPRDEDFKKIITFGLSEIRTFFIITRVNIF